MCRSGSIRSTPKSRRLHAWIPTAKTVLPWVSTPANVHDSRMALPLIDQMPRIAGHYGRPRGKPDVVLSDRAYGTPKTMVEVDRFITVATSSMVKAAKKAQQHDATAAIVQRFQFREHRVKPLDIDFRFTIGAPACSNDMRAVPAALGRPSTPSGSANICLMANEAAATNWARFAHCTCV